MTSPDVTPNGTPGELQAKDLDLLQRRKFARLKREIGIRLALLPPTRAPVAGRTLDVSFQGVRAKVGEEILAGQRVEVTFVEPASGLEIAYAGQVAWAAWVAERSCYEMGVRLTGLPEAEKENLLAVFGDGHGEDRRQYVRLAKHLAVEARKTPALFGRAALLTSSDLSLGGLAAIGATPLKPGARYRVRIFLRHEDRPFQAGARAVSSQPTPDGRHFVRFQLEAVPNDELQKLGRFLTAEMRGK